MDRFEEMKMYKEQLDQGLITREEFDAKKEAFLKAPVAPGTDMQASPQTQLFDTISDKVDKISKTVGEGIESFRDGSGAGATIMEKMDKITGKVDSVIRTNGSMPYGENTAGEQRNTVPRITVDMSAIQEPAAENDPSNDDLQRKIVALTKLMTDGILTPQELTAMIAVLSTPAESAPSHTPVEKAYYEYVRKYIAPSFKSPSSVKPAPFDPGMVREGEITLNGKKEYTKYIASYVDAPNSYGTMLREEFIIGIDEEFNMYWHAMHLNYGAILGKSSGWTIR